MLYFIYLFHYYNFLGRLPNAIALKAAHDLIDCGVSMGEISSTYKLAAHRQVTSTDCPGNVLYSDVTTWPHWTSSP